MSPRCALSSTAVRRGAGPRGGRAPVARRGGRAPVARRGGRAPVARRGWRRLWLGGRAALVARRRCAGCCRRRLPSSRVVTVSDGYRAHRWRISVVSRTGRGAGSRRRQSSGMVASSTSSTVTTPSTRSCVVDDRDGVEVEVGHQQRDVGQVGVGGDPHRVGIHQGRNGFGGVGLQQGDHRHHAGQAPVLDRGRASSAAPPAARCGRRR